MTKNKDECVVTVTTLPGTPKYLTVPGLLPHSAEGWSVAGSLWAPFAIFPLNGKELLAVLGCYSENQC